MNGACTNTNPRESGDSCFDQLGGCFLRGLGHAALAARGCVLVNETLARCTIEERDRYGHCFR